MEFRAYVICRLKDICKKKEEEDFCLMELLICLVEIC